MSLPLFGQDPSVPAARVQIASIQLGSERRGFFRVGILPMVVAKGVKIHFTKPDPTAFRDLPVSFKVLVKSDVLELRDVSIFLPGVQEAILTAELVVVRGQENWEMTRVCTGEVQAQKAFLVMSGENTGQLKVSDKTGLKIQLIK